MQARRRSEATGRAAVIAMLKGWARESELEEGASAEPQPGTRGRGAVRGAVDATAIVALIGERRGGVSDAPSSLLMV